MKNKLIFIFSLLLLFSTGLCAQSFISLSSGLSYDLINNHPNFYHVPFIFKLKPSPREKAPLFIELNYSIPIISKNPRDAYTLNPSLPEKISLQENISSYIFSVSVGFRIHLVTNKRNNSFYLNLLPLGICTQYFKIHYKNYDNQNYEVLNPDVDLNAGGPIMAMEAAYYFHKTKQDIVLLLHLQTQPLGVIGDYPLSYKTMAPLQLTLGYNFYYNK